MFFKSCEIILADQWFITGAILLHRGHLAMSSGNSGCRIGGVCYWYLVNRGQGYHKTPYNAQDMSLQPDLSGPTCH